MPEAYFVGSDLIKRKQLSEGWTGPENDLTHGIDEISMNVDNDTCLTENGKIECGLRHGYCLTGNGHLDQCPFYHQA